MSEQEEKKQTSMALTKSTLDELDKLKIHPRATYEEVVLQLIRNARSYRAYIDSKGLGTAFEAFFAKSNQKVKK